MLTLCKSTVLGAAFLAGSRHRGKCGSRQYQRFAEEHDILGVMGLTMTSATIGLILGGIIGGPVAERLIRRIARADATTAAAEGGVVGGPVSTPVTALSFISSLAAALAAVVAGQALPERIGRGRDHGAGIPVVPYRWPDHPKRRWRHKAGICTMRRRSHRLGLPLPVPDMDNDDATSGRRGADGWAAVDHPCRSGGAGRCLGDLGDVSSRRA